MQSQVTKSLSLSSAGSRLPKIEDVLEQTGLYCNDELEYEPLKLGVLGGFVLPDIVAKYLEDSAKPTTNNGFGLKHVEERESYLNFCFQLLGLKEISCRAVTPSGTTAVWAAMQIANENYKLSRQRDDGVILCSSVVHHSAFEFPCNVKAIEVSPETFQMDSNLLKKELNKDNVAAVLFSGQICTGTIEFDHEIAKHCKEKGIPLIADLCGSTINAFLPDLIGAFPGDNSPVQVASFRELAEGCDIAACDIHKFFGPMGAGAVGVKAASGSPLAFAAKKVLNLDSSYNYFQNSGLYGGSSTPHLAIKYTLEFLKQYDVTMLRYLAQQSTRTAFNIGELLRYRGFNVKPVVGNSLTVFFCSKEERDRTFYNLQETLNLFSAFTAKVDLHDKYNRPVPHQTYGIRIVISPEICFPVGDQKALADIITMRSKPGYQFETCEFGQGADRYEISSEHTEMAAGCYKDHLPVNDGVESIEFIKTVHALSLGLEFPELLELARAYRHLARALASDDKTKRREHTTKAGDALTNFIESFPREYPNQEYGDIAKIAKSLIRSYFFLKTGLQKLSLRNLIQAENESGLPPGAEYRPGHIWPHPVHEPPLNLRMRFYQFLKKSIRFFAIS